MATYDVTNKNSGDISRGGNWIWNEVTLPGLATADEFTFFKLPSNTMILGGVARVVTAGANSGGAATMAEVMLRDGRSGAIVAHDMAATALDLLVAPDGGNDADGAVALALTAATGLGKIPVAMSTDSTTHVFVNGVITVTAGPMQTAPKLLIGLRVARVDYDKA